MTHYDDELQNHSCTYQWCENSANSCDAQRLEHFTGGAFVPSTGSSLSRRLSSADVFADTVGVGLRYNEDLEPSPTIWLEISGATEAVLRLDEAVLLHKALGDIIQLGIGERQMIPARVIEHYGRGVDE